MHKHWDILLGTGGFFGVIKLSTINEVLACVAGLTTVSILIIRLGREWKNRNQPPKD
jgi:hypothetical protein